VRFRMRRPSPALVIACVALSVALGGTGYAVTRISGSQLVNRSVAGVKVKRDALGKAEIKEASIASASTPMDSRSGPLTAPFQAKFKTRGGPIVIVASGSGYRGSSGQVGMEVLVDGLVRRRLVERQPEPEDRRQRTVRLTQRGKAILRVVDRARADQFLTAVRALPGPERAIVAMGVAALATHAINRRGRLIRTPGD